MIFKKIFISVSLVLLSLFAFTQNHHERFESIDILQYIFNIHLNDTTDRIEASAHLFLKYKKTIRDISLDLININSDGLGMKVDSVKAHNQITGFTHKNNQLKINYEADTTDSVSIGELTVYYSGIPADGLIISKNKYGNRTFFGDNWPNRARHWLPSVDHPSDKASVIFAVVAPNHYKVVSNGVLEEIAEYEPGYNKTVWRENIPISTKLMVIGVADFEVGNKTMYNDIPVSSWVFKQNKEKGFENYKYGTKALEYFSELIGPYSYEKLAHVQSKTRYGGMENASCIFYSENSAVSNQSQERLFAHEVAHQWFGNSATEQNWHHVWLSEGFATYLTHVYKENFYGEDLFREGLKNDRERIIRYSKQNRAPVIDTTVTDYIRLLNANSYQKASWVLHMLRQELGDDIFFKGLRKYYAEFQNSTALTEDFQQVMEIVSGKDLDKFFKQWLWQAGHPIIEYSWNQKSNGDISFVLNQTQHHWEIFKFPLELQINTNNGTTKIIQINVNKGESHHIINVGATVSDIIIDPNTKLLFEFNDHFSTKN
uniref:M1 family metallopeptidase n=1 Tax=uncultured Draconibacterium sp. TaxID=1573823 RepID=UPI003217D22B